MRAIRACLVLLVAVASPATAADSLTALQTGAACAVLPASALPRNSVRIVGAQDVVQRHMYARGDLVVIGAGTNRGLQRDQRYYLRRGPVRTYGRSGPRGAATTGWLRIVSANEATAIGQVEFACDGISPGDSLAPFADPILPPGAERADRDGQPAFAAAGRVLFGADERTSGAARDFLLVSFGAAGGIQPGAQLAIYREINGGPLVAVGEAVVTAVHPDASIVRVTLARDAVFSGDLVVPRRP
jgi:hypothetical protein